MKEGFKIYVAPHTEVSRKFLIAHSCLHAF